MISTNGRRAGVSPGASGQQTNKKMASRFSWLATIRAST
jgi:hypothetical protein